jgi:hypothetical protein
MELSVLEDILVYSLLIGILVFAYFSIYPQPSVEGFANTPLKTAQQRLELEITTVRKKTPTFFTQTTSAPALPTNQAFLVNICPLTGYLGGYLGPPENIMDANLYLEKAFQAGIRSFVLPISTYINKSKEPPEWPFSGDPAIVCRDSADIIISVNGLTIDQFVKALIQYKSVSGFGSDPIFLFIEDAISDIDRKKIDYVIFMKKIARSLAPLDPFRITSYGSYGSVVGGQQQKKLLTEIPLTAFIGKVVISTNFDVAQDSSLSLASYANFIYSNQSTSLQTLNLEDLVGSTVNYKTNTRINLHMARSMTPLTAPSSSMVQLALDNGIQYIPIPLLSTPMDTVSELWAMWNGASYRLKAESYRYTQPTPVVPAQVSTKLNASIQGREPGNLVVN